MIPSRNKGAYKSAALIGILTWAMCFSPGCDNPTPGAGVRWSGYPAVNTSTRAYDWLVLKCQLSDNNNIPAGLDKNIQNFLGIGGVGYGNLVDYFHDISYNAASVVATGFVGWVTAPFGSNDLAFPNGRLAPPNQRGERVKECMQAVPAEQGVDFSNYYGIVVINNVVNDGGACYTGQQNIKVNNQNYNLACVWFDPNSLFVDFAAHEITHGLGLNHSFDDSGRNCGASPGEYCDPWDIMSAMRTYTFPDRNWLIAGSNSAAGPGMDAANLFRMGWIPSGNWKQYDLETGGKQFFKLRALSHAQKADTLMVLLDIGQTAFEGVYTVEYRQSDGWDSGFGVSQASPAVVRSTGGTVLVHQLHLVGEPSSELINGAFGGALQPLNTIVVPGVGGLVFHVTVLSINTQDASANVEVGSGPGLAPPRFGIQGMASHLSEWLH